MTRERYAERRRGQALVEFALVIPIFLLMVFGLLDMGRAVYSNHTLSQAAREAARLAAAQASWVGETTATEATCNTIGGPVCPADVAALKANVDAAANRMAVGLGVIPSAQVHMQCNPSTSAAPTGAWTGSTCATRSSGSLVSVRIAYTFTMITPVVGQIADNLSLSASATMVIN
jgi:Flp pilus assembly protein TadG